ncbi:MAG TPA: dihydrolipoyl dehydrogenase [Sphingomonas sp.]|jgi:dihydrolipoamide dehydrogenase|uniref:dihydrolipoyl dehydrogenase n=1 Tax=Sphingomonas sp. TaxID=28214 RepID=UPI002EDAE1AA
MNCIDCDVAILGAGTAGLAAYRAATDAGAHAVLIDPGPGGTLCARAGCMPSKALIAAARSAHHARQAAGFGIRVGEVVVDGAAVMDRVRRERDYFVGAVLKDVHAIPADRRITGRARFVAPDRLAVTHGPDVAAAAIVIAVGTAPTLPDLLDPVRAWVHSSDTIFDIARPPATLAVLGAGAIGLELAAAFARLGTRVTLIDKAAAIGNIADPDVQRVARARLSTDIDFRLGSELRTATPTPTGAHLRWDGDSSGEGTFDCILAAVGRPPALDGIGLDASGLARDDHGTPHFDAATGRCGDSRIFVAGDARGCRPVLHEAARSGRLAGHNAACPAAMRRDPILPAFSVIFTDPQIVAVGCSHDALPSDTIVGTATFQDNGRVHIDGGGDGLLRLYADCDGELLGGAIVGLDAEQIGHLLALALSAGLSLGDLADQPYYHPTIPEILQRAARDALTVLDRCDR